jgi:hypothetical protein
MDQVRSFVPQNYGGLVTVSDWILRTGVRAVSQPVAAVEPSSDLLAMTVAMGILRNGRAGGVLTRLLRQRRWWGSQGSGPAFS